MVNALTAEQADVWERSRRMSVQLSGRLSRELARATGLSEADYEILTALAGTAGASVRALTLRCGLEWEKSRLSHQLRRMERRGLIVRGDSPDDGRGATVAITAAGLEAVARARQCHEEAVRRYLADAVTPRQLAALAEIAEAVLNPLTDGEPAAHA